jgi:carbamoyl-phosphate synthase large subunit
MFDLILTDTVDLVIDIPTRNNNLKNGFLMRRFAVEAGIPIYTSLDTAQALITSLQKRHQGDTSLIDITQLR